MGYGETKGGGGKNKRWADGIETEEHRIHRQRADQSLCQKDPVARMF